MHNWITIIILTIISAIGIGYFGLFLIWGKILNTDFILLFIFLGLVIFLFLITRIKEKSKGKFILKSLAVIFFYPFAYGTLMVSYKELSHTPTLQKYKNFKCKNSIIDSNDSVIMLKHGSSYMNEDYFYITRNTIHFQKDYEENPPQTQYKLIKSYVPPDNKFKVIGKYGSNYLLKSLSDNKLAWVWTMYFDIKQCTINENQNYDDVKKPRDINETLIDVNLTGKKKIAF